MFLGVRQQFRGQKSVAALAAQLGGCLAGGCLAASRATRWLLGSRAERRERVERPGPSRATRWLLGAAQLGELLGAYLPVDALYVIACRRRECSGASRQGTCVPRQVERR
ncbi:hypothetical protein GW17_00039638 [Ensete ventricosum]|nr:hypothetical protein GW17_00039638 [Ensete ventricosum]